SRSPSLARELLQEMTSLESAEERARSGAGIPSRRDFFELRGHEPVPGMEPLTWLEVLRYCGARSRRRERVAPRANAARLYQVIQDELLACLQVAYHSRADYHANRTQTVQRMSRFARQAFDRIQLEATN